MKSLCFFLYIFSILCLLRQSYAQTTVGPNNAGAGANSGVVAWANPNNILTSNNSYAQATNGVTGFLQASNFGFAIPLASTITGVLVEIERRANPVNAVTSTGWVQRTMANYTGSASATATYGTTTHTYTLPTPAGANRMMVVMIGIENTDQVVAPVQDPSVNITGVTYNGIAMTFGVTNYIAGAATGNRVAIYYLLEAQLAALTAGTTYNLVVTKNFPGDATGGITPNEYVEIVGINTYNFVNQTAPIDFSSNALAANPAAIAATAAFTNSRDGDLIVAATMNNGPGGSITQAATYTENFENLRNNVGAGGAVGAILEVQSKTLTAPAGNETVSATATGAGRLVICGIAIRAARVYDNAVQLMQGGVTVGSNYAIPSTFPNAWPDTDTYISYGGLADLWGTTWTPAQINAANFGVSLQANALNATAFVDHIRITVRYTIILAAEIRSMEVVKVNNRIQSTLLFTTTDYEAYKFVFEKSEDGFNFVPVQTLNAQGNKEELQKLVFYDVLPRKGVMYYRIKIVELKDNKASYTSIKAISGEQEDNIALLVYPNPCEGQINVQINGGFFQEILLHDTKGQLVMSKIANDYQNKDLVNIPAYLPKGIYFLSVITAQQILREKIIVN